MEFKTPSEFKRKSLGRVNESPTLFKSPQNRKKFKPSQLSTTIASPVQHQTQKDLFDDNFSQFFRTQFIQRIDEDVAALDKNASFKKSSANDVNFSSYNFTQNFSQLHGFTQMLTESQFKDDEIPSGQRLKPNSTAAVTDDGPNEDLSISQCINAATHQPKDDEDFHDRDNDIHGIEQSSQVFLNEITAVQLNISEIIDETISANKSAVSDDLELVADDKFNVFRSDATQSQYVQLKRENQSAVHDPFNGNATPAASSTRNIDIDAMDEDDKLLANLDEDFLGSGQLNDCIDPNSSALHFSDEDAPQNQSIHPTDETIQAIQELMRHENIDEQTSTINVQRPVTSAHFCSMGPFFGLPLKVKALIKEFKQIDDLYDWQKECLQLPAIHLKQNLIYALPTSGGKTLVSEILILRELICRRKNCLFILPYVSIVQEKVWALSPFSLNLDFLVEEYAAGKGVLPPRKRQKKRSVYIATIEKAMALFDSLIENGRAGELGLVIVDELHMIGDGHRGAIIESLLTKIQYMKAGIQIVGMSATMGNMQELATFLNADIYHKNFRPVELQEYVKCGADLLAVNKEAHDIENAFVKDRTVSFNYSEKMTKMDPDHITGLVSEVVPDKSCLIFCASKKNCENLATLLSKLLPKKYVDHKLNERDNLIKAIENDMGSKICPILAKTIPCGIAYHHSGLTADERRHLEESFRLGILCIICCTSTLAAGVNLPAKRVIIRSPYVGSSFITLSRYKQMVGRAGRAGFGENGESILICSPRDNQQVLQLLISPMDEVMTQIHQSDAGVLSSLVLSAIGLGIATTRTELQKLVSHTLLHVQATRLDVNPSKLIDEIISRLIKSKALVTKADKDRKPTSDSNTSMSPSQETSFYHEIPLSQKKVILKPSTQLEVSILGKASFKSAIDLNRAKIVYSDLQQAQKSLVLLDYFHLLYIVTPFDDKIATSLPDRQLFYTKYSELTETELFTSRIIGVTESVANKMISGQVLKVEQERIVKKFFSTMILNALWQMKPVADTANAFKIDRGLVQNLMGMAAIEAGCLLKFCEELEEFWAFRELFKNLSQRLGNICTVELVPLMQLPSVKLGRAKQLFAAGYKKIEDIARAKPKQLVAEIEHLSNRHANQLISAAKVIFLEKMENLREEAQECMDVFTAKNY